MYSHVVRSYSDLWPEDQSVCKNASNAVKFLCSFNPVERPAVCKPKVKTQRKLKTELWSLSQGLSHTKFCICLKLDCLHLLLCYIFMSPLITPQISDVPSSYSQYGETVATSVSWLSLLMSSRDKSNHHALHSDLHTLIKSVVEPKCVGLVSCYLL